MAKKTTKKGRAKGPPPPVLLGPEHTPKGPKRVAYTITQPQADQLLADRSITGALKALIQRHRLKYLATPDRTTSIPLTADERKVVQAAGLDLPETGPGGLENVLRHFGR